MSIRYKILFSLLLIAFLSLPLNLYLLARYMRVTQQFMNITEITLPRLEAMLTMQNLTGKINLYISNFDRIVQQTSANTSTPSKIGALKDEFLSLLEELGEQQKIYQQKANSTVLHNAEKLNQLREAVIMMALDVFSAKERGALELEMNKKIQRLELTEQKLNDFIKTALLQESNQLEQEQDFTENSALALRNVMIAINTLIIIITFFLSFFLMRVISRPIIKLSQFADDIDYDHLTPLLPLLTNDEIGQLQTHINLMLIKLAKAKTGLIESSRAAGVSEITTSILHNVGNVLNSVNTSVDLMAENNRQSYLTNLPKVLQKIEENKHCLTEYLSQDEQGKHLLEYFAKLTEQLEKERTVAHEELIRLTKNLTHVNQIIAMQQNNNRPGAVIEENIDLNELVEDVVSLFANRLRKLKINVVRQYNCTPIIILLKNQIQQILINLFKNAIESLAVSDHDNKRIIIAIDELKTANCLRITITDNGIGISNSDFKKIFAFGFTTKKDGHGYGLHNCAILAKELGGELNAVSGGSNQGATFSLELIKLKRPKD